MGAQPFKNAHKVSNRRDLVYRIRTAMQAAMGKELGMSLRQSLTAKGFTA
jgi:hypothetical protein